MLGLGCYYEVQYNHAQTSTKAIEIMSDMRPFSDSDENTPLTDINKTFYHDYDSEYFTNKAIVLGGIIADTSPTTNHLNRGYSVGKITIEKADISKDWLIGYAKREMVINSYHSIESFFRLFFAHYENPDCPWVGVEQMQSFRDFKKRVESLVNHEYFEKLDHDEMIANLLLGGREVFEKQSEDEWKDNVKHVIELVDTLGHEILSNQDYNVYKHGAALLDTQFGFKIDDGKLLGAHKQDTFMYLSSEIVRTPEKVIKRFNKTFKFTRWERTFAVTYLTGQLLHNLLNIEKLRLKLSGKDGVSLSSFHLHDIHKILEDKSSTGAIVVPTTVSERLFERHYDQTKNTKKGN